MRIACLSVLSANAAPTYALQWQWHLFVCSNGLFIKMYSMYEIGKKKKHYLGLWVAGLGMSGSVYFGPEKLHIARAYTASWDCRQVGGS